jgi:metal-dependent amidase/aminoacylase/carboxypeptidase family protein
MKILNWAVAVNGALRRRWAARPGIETRTGIANTGVFGVSPRGAQAGKTVLLRADMDALPMS